MRTFFNDESDNYSLASHEDMAKMIWNASCEFENEHWPHDQEPITAKNFFGISYRIHHGQRINSTEDVLKHFMVQYMHSSGISVSLGFDDNKFTFYRNERKSIFKPAEKFSSTGEPLLKELNSFFKTHKDVSSLIINNTNFSRICYEHRDNEWIDFYRAHALANENYWFTDEKCASFELGFGVDRDAGQVRYFNVGYPAGEMESYNVSAADQVEFFYDARKPVEDRLDFEFYWYNLKKEKDHMREALLKYF